MSCYLNEKVSLCGNHFCKVVRQNDNLGLSLAKNDNWELDYISTIFWLPAEVTYWTNSKTFRKY